MKVNLFFLDHPEISGIFNVGTGRAQSFNDVACATVNAVRRSRGEAPLSARAAAGGGRHRVHRLSGAARGQVPELHAGRRGRAARRRLRRAVPDRRGRRRALCRRPHRAGAAPMSAARIGLALALAVASSGSPAAAPAQAGGRRGGLVPSDRRRDASQRRFRGARPARPGSAPRAGGARCTTTPRRSSSRLATDSGARGKFLMITHVVREPWARRHRRPCPIARGEGQANARDGCWCRRRRIEGKAGPMAS